MDFRLKQTNNEKN